MRVLAVEDDAGISEMMVSSLTRAGHVVEVAANGEDGLWMATEFDFDVVVLDWNLPGSPDGIAVCRALREAGRWMPILMLTGRSAVEERVEGLQAGADDYLTKPFAVPELCARLQALGRRAPHARPTVLTVGDLALDPAARTVQRGGVEIRLRPKEFSLLELLMRRAGEALGRDKIMEGAWDMNFDGMSNVIDVHIRSLRAKIDEPFGRKTIETVPRVGYRLAAADAA